MSNRTGATVIVGLQWGDEGKGRIVDYYARDYDVVARFGGGDNAGHTIAVGERKLALRIVPSAVLQERCELFIGGGTVVSLQTLRDELQALQKIGLHTARIKISDRAHVVFPYHAQADRAAEERRGAAALGTTGRGIGPAYVDRIARTGITFGDLLQHRSLEEKLRAHGAQELLGATVQEAQFALPLIVDGVEYIHRALERKHVLIEGAQGALLDVGYGTYPYVTSSHTIAGGACTGLGIGPHAIANVVGVVKAYATRVGSGPFPSELHGAHGDELRKAGREFGTVTGRPRRCGWFDAVAGSYACALNGLDAIALTKLDVLSGLDRIGIVTGYQLDGKPASFASAAEPTLQVEVEYMDGWRADLSGVRRIGDLPKTALRYVQRIEGLLGVRAECVSVGPERTQIAVI